MLDDLATAILNSNRVVALTGAGISTDSGIPDFRSDEGLWEAIDPMDVASIEGFEADTARFYRFWADKFGAIASADPGPSHLFLANLERAGHLTDVITQNIDGLHQKAGSTKVHEAHGSFREVRCLSCGHIEGVETVFERAGERAPACQKCGGRRLKPGVVLFGELLPRAFADGEWAAKNAEVLLTMGTSLRVEPVAGLVDKAHRRGARVAIINREATPYDGQAEWVIRGELREVMEKLQGHLAQKA